MATTRQHALLAGGGSGGHIFPALAVADALRGAGWEVTFAGRGEGLEARLVAEKGHPFMALAARPVVGKGPGAKIRALLTLAASAWKARGQVRRRGAAVALGTGGYASAPAILGARLAGLPIVLLEPNASPGAANRWLSRFATEAAVAHRATGATLRCPATLTGVPIRDVFFSTERRLPAGPEARILILGGSQGALQLNRIAPPAVARLAGRFPALRVLHQCGERWVDEARRAYAKAGAPEGVVEVTPFIDDVARAMEASRLIVSRAGAITQAEICAAGRPALYVPLSIAGGHQIDNARALVEAGAAAMLSPEEADDEHLGDLLGTLLADDERLCAMGEAAAQQAHPGAAQAIAERMIGLVHETQGRAA